MFASRRSKPLRNFAAPAPAPPVRAPTAGRAAPSGSAWDLSAIPAFPPAQLDPLQAEDQALAPQAGGETEAGAEAASAPGSTWDVLQAAADQLRAGDSRQGPIIPVTLDLLSLFTPMAPRKPSLPSKFKDAPYTEFRGRAFVKGAGDAHEVDQNDVHQAQLGDCGLHSAMIAIARVNPEAIKSLITEKADGTYDVTLHFKDHIWSDKTPHVINVTPTFPTDASGAPLFSQRGDVGPDGPELWAMLIEKAFAMHAGGYDDAEGIWDHAALDLLAKTDADKEQKVNALTEAEMGKAINAKVSSGTHAVTANTSQSRFDEWTRSEAGENEIKSLGIVMVHAYAIVAVDETAKTLDLRNPWGHHHLTGLSFAAFRKYFYTWSSVKVK